MLFRVDDKLGRRDAGSIKALFCPKTIATTTF